MAAPTGVQADVGPPTGDAKVFYEGKVVHALGPGQEVSFGRHSSCDIRLEGPRNAKGEPLLSRRVGLMWFRDGYLRIRNTSSHVLLAEADTGETLTLEPRHGPAPSAEASILGESVRVQVMLAQWRPAEPPIQLREELVVTLPSPGWLQRKTVSETQGTTTVTADLSATSAEELVLAALCREKVIHRDKDRPAPSHARVARVLVISRSTVRKHVDHLREKNGQPPHKEALATLAYEQGWVTRELLTRRGLLKGDSR